MITQVKTNRLLAFSLLLVATFAQAQTRDTVASLINAGLNPAGIGISPNGRFAYIPNQNVNGFEGQDSISVINLDDNGALVKTITDSTFNEPSSVVFNSTGTKAYVTNENGTSITVLNPATNQITASITGFQGPSRMVIAPNNRIGYVINSGTDTAPGNTLDVVDLINNTITQSITLPQTPTNLAISRTGAFVYVVNSVPSSSTSPSDMDSLSIIRTSDNTVAGTVTGFSGPSDIALSANGQFAYVTNMGSDDLDPIGSTVSVVNLNTRMIVDTINVGIQPSSIAITPNGRYAYVTNMNDLSGNPDFPGVVPGQSTVSIIRLSDNKVISPTIPVGQGASDITITRDGYALVSNDLSNTVSVIRVRG